MKLSSFRIIALAVPISLQSSQIQHLIIPPSQKQYIPQKFLVNNKLRRPLTVRSYNGIYGKLFLVLENSFAVYARIFNSFGAMLSVFGLGVLFPPIFNASFLRNVFLQRKGKICREASTKLGENMKQCTILYENSNEMILLWGDTNHMAHLKRTFGVWKVRSFFTEAKEIPRQEFSDEDFKVRNKVICQKYTENAIESMDSV